MLLLPAYDIAHLRQGELLPDAYPWPPVERDVRPGAGSPRLPSLRHEVEMIGEACRRRWIDVGPTVQDEGGITDGRLCVDV